MNKRLSLINRIFAVASIAAVLAPAMVLRADVKVSTKPLSEEQRIIHVLNRLGFGARPGDVAKVKVMGLQKYIDQQLNAASVDDSVAEAKVKNFDVFNMSTAEVFAKYPNPGALLRQLEGGRVAQAQAQEKKNAEMPNGTAAVPPASSL